MPEPVQSNPAQMDTRSRTPSAASNLRASIGELLAAKLPRITTTPKPRASQEKR